MESEALKNGTKGHDDTEKATTTREWLKKEMKINKGLLSTKLILFLFVGGVTCFLPYLTLHMQELGMSINQISIIYAVLPVAAMVGPTISGLLADKLGYYTLVLNANVVFCVIFHTLLLFVPYEKRNNLEFHCSIDAPALKWSNCDNELQLEQNMTYFSLENCKSKCENVNLCFEDTKSSNASYCMSTNLKNSSIEQIYLDYTADDSSNCLLSLKNIVTNNEAYDSLTCSAACPMICSVGNKTNNYDVEKAKGLAEPYFYMYFAIRIIATSALASAFTMTDAVVLNKIKDVGGDFGKQRMICVLSQSVMPLLAGILVDAINYDGSNQVDYSAAFYLGDALLLIDVFIISRMSMKVKATEGNVWKEAGKLLQKIEIDIFMITIVFLGSCWGFLETYLFVFLKFLGAPTYLLGLTLTVGSAFGLPGTFFADTIVKKVGRGKIFFMSFIAYFVRFLGYSYIPTAWYCFPFEILEVLTYQVMWVAAATYCPVLAPANLLATMTGLAGAAHYSLGRGLGTFVGGYLIGQFGLVMTFRSVAYACLICGLLQALSHKFIIQKKIKERKLLLAAASLTSRQEEEKRNSLQVVSYMMNTSRRTSLAM